MTEPFYKNLVALEKIEKLIKSSAMSADEKEELWKIIDEIVHHRIMGCVLDNLPREHHEEFLTKIKNESLDFELMEFLETKSQTKISDKIKEEIIVLEEEILKDINA